MTQRVQDFDKVLSEQLELIDELLSFADVPPQRRPLDATLLFIKYCVVAVEGDDDTEHPFGKRWFRELFEHVSKWYAVRYAAAMQQKEETCSRGLILILNTPFRVDIPLVLFEPAPNHTGWMTIPKEVLPSERVLNWIVNPPNLDRIDDEELSQVSEAIAKVATQTRGIHNDLMTAQDPHKDLQRLISSIPLHIDRSVEDILRGDGASRGLAVWEMHLAIEKTLKLLLRQNGVVEKAHNLTTLAGLANQLPGVAVDKVSLGTLPSEKEAIQARYGEAHTRPLQELVSNYQTVLKLTADLAKALKREWIFDNAKFLIRSPLW